MFTQRTLYRRAILLHSFSQQSNSSSLSEKYLSLHQSLYQDMQNCRNYTLTTIEQKSTSTFHRGNVNTNPYTKSIEAHLISQNNVHDLFNLSSQENDIEIISECYNSIVELKHKFNELRLELALYHISQGNTTKECFVEVRAGTGGQDAYDWTNMLSHLLQNFLGAERGFRVDLIETQVDSASDGLRSATLKVVGTDSWAWLCALAGVHRLVRVSPFDSQGKRHTSFAQVSIFPVPDPAISKTNVELKAEDLRIDTYRSSGAGGQHVNTTDSAVRITHLPTGLVASCQNERSQHKNKATALLMLQSKLNHLLQQRAQIQRRDGAVGLDTRSGDTSWGAQVTSVVLHPYQMVKCHRSGYQSGLAQEYLTGGPVVAQMIEAYLLHALDSAIVSNDKLS